MTNYVSIHRLDDLIRKLHERQTWFTRKSGLLFDPEANELFVDGRRSTAFAWWIESLSKLSSLSLVLAQSGNGY